MTLEVPEISVVIPTLNREKPLCDTLRYFLEIETYPIFEVIVIDQSDVHVDATRDFLAQNAARIRYVPADYKSLPRARNHGVQLARGEIVVFVDDDVEPTAGFLLAHARCYVDPAVVGVAGPLLQDGQGLTSRTAIGERAYWTLVQRRGMRFDVDFSFSAQWAAGCNMSFRRALIIEVGGFDETFYGAAIGEDAEFSHRAKKKGTIWYSPDARLVHLAVPKGGCRDAVSHEYHRQVAFCVNYYLHRVEVGRSLRWVMVWRAFRGNVFNRKALAGGGFLQSLLSFAEGLWKSSVHISRLNRDQGAHISASAAKRPRE